MPKKLVEAAARRLFLNIFICMKCNARLRAQPEKVRKKLVKCRKCGSKQLRPKAKERRGAKA